MSSLPPPAYYVPMVIPYPGAPGAPMFDGRNITHFLIYMTSSAQITAFQNPKRFIDFPGIVSFLLGGTLGF